ncbi:2-(3-amino-3-carboxypropyl)histidine synthase subunit 2-like isoform X2 [Lineus longissimus]|uniref:2-(3-amino-3-carboxypropyl)histidine synthase subunit 2-like isoform X2 n=1 Tax=Lineus longissimus TaxID=88925 RepID=UPI002B4F1EA1
MKSQDVLDGSGKTISKSCCVDEVAAQHYSADAVIHFGHACLSPTRRYPVLYVFGRRPLDVPDCCEKFRQLFPNRDKKIVVLYDTIYLHAVGTLRELLLKSHPGVVLSKLKDISTDKTETEIQDTDIQSTTKCGRNFTHGQNAIEEYSMFYIGAESLTLTNLIMTFNKCQFYTYDPETKKGRMETVNVNRMLGKRFRNIDMAKDAKIIGIVAGTLGVADYLEIINRLKSIIKEAGKKSYTFVMGKVNVPKMANFLEIDVFVLVACPENSMIDSREFYKPILTPYEMEVACNRNREWDGTLLSDYREILPGGAAFVEMPEKMEAMTDVSLVTGSLRTLGVNKEDAVVKNESAIMKRNDMGVVANVGAADAGEFLKARTWQGLEEKLGETPVIAVEEGLSGIAVSYSHGKPEAS